MARPESNTMIFVLLSLDIASVIGNDLPGIASQFATRNLGFALQFCNYVARNCVKHIVRTGAVDELVH